MAYDAHGFRARAVHTDRPTLATAAYMDWSAELRRLHELRHGREVLLHWCHAVEIQHFPPHFDRMPELPGVLPPVRVAACVAANCAVVRREGAGSSSRGSGPLPDGMCWWRPVYLRRWHGLELVPAAHAFQLRKCVRPRPTSRLTMWRRATSIDWWRCWQNSRRGATRVWLQPMIFGKCGGHGNEASGAGGSPEPVAGRETAIRDAVARAGRALWFWLGSIEAASRTSILLAQPVDSPLCSCATYATASCALIALSLPRWLALP